MVAIWSRDGLLDFACSVQKRKDTEFHYREQRMHVQITFAQNVKSLEKVIEKCEIHLVQLLICLFWTAHSAELDTMRH